jgi:hypothetical protein
MKHPDISNKMVSEQLLMIDSDGKRHVGYYHCNGYYYRWDGYYSTKIDNIVYWEYLNSPYFEFVIQGDKDPTDNTDLYWNNEMGWGDFESATIFKKEELYSIHMPIEMSRIVWIQNGQTWRWDTLEEAFSR